MDPIKEAFQKVKEDLFSLQFELESQRKLSLSNREYLEALPEVLQILKEQNKQLIERVKRLEQKITNYESSFGSLITTLSRLTNQIEFTSKEVFLIKKVLREMPTDRQQKQENPTQNPTDISLFELLKAKNQGTSIGNGGVPTNKQTNKQTDQQTDKSSYNQEENISTKKDFPQKKSVDEVAEILDSLDNLKKELRLKFKRLTNQEIAVFSTIYQLEEQGELVDYGLVAGKLGLTESSIRDYVGRLIKKDIPVDKLKINNKSVQLSISKNLKKIASLSTILQLRDL